MMNKMDYRDRLNNIFGQGKSPSSLRSIFDCDSAEWQGTVTEKKINTLELMVQSGYSLDNWISDYVNQYKKTHPHILRAISKSLTYLSEKSADQELKNQIRNWVKSSDGLKMKESKINVQLIAGLSEKCTSVLPLSKELDKEFFYANLHLCVIDTVFSIGVKYGGVQNVIKRVVDYFQHPVFSVNKVWSDRKEQVSITQFLELIENMSSQMLADEVFKNQQRTSTRSGILKAEAVVQFLHVLRDFNVNYFQDVENVFANVGFESAIKNIKGQGSGISLSYFYMLAGNDEIIKPDRMVMDFLFDNTGVLFTLEEAQIVLFETARQVSERSGKSISARHLDNLIWGYQRVQKK